MKNHLTFADGIFVAQNRSEKKNERKSSQIKYINQLFRRCVFEAINYRILELDYVYTIVRNNKLERCYGDVF